MIRRLTDRLRWRTLRGDLDYAAAGDLAWLLLSRRGRRTVQIAQDRDTLLDLARCIIDDERRQRELCEYGDPRRIWDVPPDPALVNRVLNAARQVASLRSFDDAQGWRRVADAHLELRAAVDALDGEPDSETDALVVPLDDANLPDWEREFLERQDAQRPDAPPETNGDGTDDPDPTDGAPEAGTERSGGVGWNRHIITELITHARFPMFVGEPIFTGDVADQVEALLADVDRLRREQGGRA